MGDQSTCTYLDRSIPEVRGDHVFFTAFSGDSKMLVCMSRSEAVQMANEVIRVLATADARERMGTVLEFGRS